MSRRARSVIARALQSSTIPPVVEDLVLYLDPSNASKVALTGSTVDSIRSVVGSDLAANSGANRPAYNAGGLNGRAMVECESVNTEYLLDDTSDGAAQLSDNGVFSLYFVVVPTNVTSKQFISFKNNVPNNYCGVGTNGAGNLRFFRGAAGVTVNDIGGGALSAAVHQISFVYSGSAISAWVDGASRIAAVAAAADLDAITGLVYGSGWFGVLPSQPMDGSLGRVLLYRAAHSTAVRQSIEGWLRAYYSL